MISSPCTKVCKMSDDDLYCIGCYRTRKEIQDWRFLSDSQKMEIINQLSKRGKPDLEFLP
jgi:hypothetical protein